MKGIILLSGFLFQAVSGLWAQERFIVDISCMEPRQWPAQSLPPGYVLSLVGDSVRVELPYRGKAYQLHAEETLPHFKARVTDYLVKKRNKGRVELEFKAQYRSAWFAFRITACPDGRAQVLLTPSHAESIRYEGFWQGTVPH